MPPHLLARAPRRVGHGLSRPLARLARVGLLSTLAVGLAWAAYSDSAPTDP